MNEKTFEADVLQYMMPDGRQVHMKTPLPVECLEAYEAMEAANCRLEAEVLSTGEVSVTISDSEYDRDCRVVKNGPDVKTALAAMLNRRTWEEEN